jgi:hypothetical protein
VASNPSPNLVLTSVSGETRELSQWTTTFHLASVVLDPFTNESAWVLKPAARILEAMRGAAARVNFVVCGTAEEAKAFLGPLADEFLVFADPERALARDLHLAELPAFVFIRSDGTLQGAAEGWHPKEWKAVADTIATATAWIAPPIPHPGDPSPFHGTPAVA